MSKLYLAWLFVGSVIGVLLFVFGASLSQFQLSFGCFILVVVFVTSMNLYGEAKVDHNKRIDIQDGIDKENRDAANKSENVL